MDEITKNISEHHTLFDETFHIWIFMPMYTCKLTMSSICDFITPMILATPDFLIFFGIKKKEEMEVEGGGGGGIRIDHLFVFIVWQSITCMQISMGVCIVVLKLIKKQPKGDFKRTSSTSTIAYLH